MTGIVLLDEEQQRTLYQQRSQQQVPSTRRVRVGSMPSTPRSEPRTDFTSRGNNNPTSVTSGSSAGKPSTGTFQSNSPRTDFTSRGGGTIPPLAPVLGDVTGIGYTNSYPMLRPGSDVASSSDETDHDGKPANLYAGASSGLKISITYILVGVAVGLALGIALSELEVSPLVARWVSLPGDLFLRALKCLVIPYVFCAVAVAIGDIVFVGKVSVIGMQTIRVFLLFWVTTTMLGMGVALLFRPMFRLDQSAKVAAAKTVGFTCANGKLLETLVNGTVTCSASSMTDSATAFTVLDVHNRFQKTSAPVLTQLSLSDQLMAMLTSVVSSNILQSVADGELLSTITFAMVLGSIAGRSYFTKSRRVNYVYLVLLQLRNTFFLAMEWIIWLTPVAVISIIAGSFASNQESLRQIGSLYIYVVAAFTAASVHFFLLCPAIIFVLTRCNPYNHMRKMLRAYLFAFACSSSLATAPVTLSCIRKAKVCSQSLANFVISLGVCSNVSAAGFYFPIGVIFLAESSGNGDGITALHLVGIFFLSLLSCAGTPPIPAAGLVVTATIYKTIFGVSEVPSTFPYLIAMDFFVDRMATVCNVHDDIMALKVIAENTDETVTQEQLGERY